MNLVAQWRSAAVVPGEPCRGCLSLSHVHRTGHLHAMVRSNALKNEVRETEAGAYCFACYLSLPICKVCGARVTSHAEYPCVDCELEMEAETQRESGGRTASPTYRGWSVIYNLQGSDRGHSSRRKHG